MVMAELMLKSGSGIKESPRKIDVSMLIVENKTSSGEITLDQLPEMEIFTKVIATVKVVQVNDAVQLSEKMKQDVVVADECATSRVTLWEEQVGALEQGRSYILKNFVVRVSVNKISRNGRCCRNCNDG